MVLCRGNIDDGICGEDIIRAIEVETPQSRLSNQESGCPDQRFWKYGSDWKKNLRYEELGCMDNRDCRDDDSNILIIHDCQLTSWNMEYLPLDTV